MQKPCAQHDFMDANKNRSYYDAFMQALQTSFTAPVSVSAPNTPAISATPARAPDGAACPRWRSQDLLAQAQQAEIAHGDQVYRLRLTALGKLILTK